jgi:glycosyltransferase involved in cell wall biosynthesis
MHVCPEKPSAFRLLVICHGYPPYYGGAEHAAGALAAAAVKEQGCRVSVLTSDIGGRLKSEETINGVRIIRIQCRKKEWARHSVPELVNFYTVAGKQVPRLNNEIAPDHILAVFTMPAGLVARKWSAVFGIPYTVVLQGSDVPGYQPGRFRLLHPLMRLVARRVWAGAHSVVAVSSPLAVLARKTWPHGNVQVIPNGVDTERFRPGKTRTDEQIRIVVLAQLIRRKGIQYLVQALERLDASTREKCLVDVYGTGPFRTELEKMTQAAGLEEILTFHGLLEGEKTPDTLRNADVFVLPSLQEGMPLALLEAMASGLPAIATSVGDVPSAIEDGNTGLLVPPGDVEALGAALARIVTDQALRQRLGPAARKKAEDYDWKRIWARYAEGIESPKSKVASQRSGSANREIR